MIGIGENFEQVVEDPDVRLQIRPGNFVANKVRSEKMFD